MQRALLPPHSTTISLFHPFNWINLTWGVDDLTANNHSAEDYYGVGPSGFPGKILILQMDGWSTLPFQILFVSMLTDGSHVAGRTYLTARIFHFRRPFDCIVQHYFNHNCIKIMSQEKNNIPLWSTNENRFEWNVLKLNLFAYEIFLLY